jgi:putative spermidine/putrescine transport system ATP-binding protein
MSSPQNSFVAQFIGENNTLMGTVEDQEGRRRGQLDNGEMIDTKPVNVSSRRAHAGFDPARAGRVQQGNGCSPDAHTLKAEVLEFIYMGDIYRTRLRVAGNDDFHHQDPQRPGSAPAEARSEDRDRLAPQDCRALDA